VDKEVKIGEIKISNAKDNLAATGIGSCLIVTFYDANKKMGALAHAMLPNLKDKNRIHNPVIEKQRDTRYVHDAIDEILKEMETMGMRRGDLECKLIGGANMFGVYELDIGSENVISAREKLKKEGINIVGEAIGGSQGRSVDFSVETGIVTVKMKF
jgi:chemotaxis protein CheD